MDIPIIPKPNKIEINDHYFYISNETTIVTVDKLITYCNLLHDIIKAKSQLSLKITNNDKCNIESKIVLSLNSTFKDLGNEGYSLKIIQNSIIISASNTNGIFYGIQTIRQIFNYFINTLKPDNKTVLAIRCMNIEDRPQFSWRGFMLDEARHFHGKETVKKIIDIMAIFKMNIFHWHLTDDQGWRIEIKKYPLLTIKGSVRHGTQLSPLSRKKIDKNIHKGFYSQEEIKEIIRYAEKRNIKIIPEIDMPGHIMSALASYPNYGCTGGPYDVPEHFGIMNEILCVGNKESYTFVTDILGEVIDLFPGKIIHIGGDEVPKNRWKKCPRCQNIINSEGLNNLKSLQVYFTNKISSYLKEKNRITMGWNQILDDNLSKNVIGQYWILGMKKVLSHLQKGRQFVMSPFKSVYLDYNYNFIPLKNIYNYDPIPKKLSRKYHSNILGIEAPLWTEWVPNIERLEWQVFPRLLAIAETGWTQKKFKNYKDFYARLLKIEKFLNELNINYAKIESVQPCYVKRFWNILRSGIITR